MGGADKGLLEAGGKPILARVVERLNPQVGDLVINANGDPRRFAAFGLPVVADAIADFAGPLAGILAGLEWSATHVARAVYMVSVPSDTPFLPPDLVARLLEAVRHRPRAIAVAGSGGVLHHVIGLWPLCAAGDLERALREGVRKVQAFTQAFGRVPVEFPFVEVRGRRIDPFLNANTPEELEEVRALLAQIGEPPAP
jgi:molybdopterin-guanine dinucleotide biosynthesis protein A